MLALLFVSRVTMDWLLSFHEPQLLYLYTYFKYFSIKERHRGLNIVFQCTYVPMCLGVGRGHKRKGEKKQ